MTTTPRITEYAVYIGPAGPDVDWEPMKIYRVAPAESGDPADYLRVIDGSGDDYLYPRERFEPIELPQRVAAAMRHGAK